MSMRIRTELGQLAQRFPFCTACILLSVVLAAASLFLRTDLREFEHLQQARTREGERMLGFIARGSQLRSETATIRAAAQRITENLVVEKNIPENFWYFYKMEQDTQTKLTELQQRPAPVSDTAAPVAYKRVPYSLRITGGFRPVMAYLQRVETGARFGRINSFVLQRQDATSSNMLLVLDLDLLAFP
jgi:Tfp pilus assembly protein PilO